MKQVLFLVLLPVVVLSAPSSKMDLLEKLLQKLERRQLEETTPNSEGITYQADTTDPSHTYSDTEMTTSYGMDTSASVSTDSPTSDTPDDISTPVNDMMSTTSSHDDDKEMAPREYIREATEGVCMLLAFVKGEEQLGKLFGNNGGPSMMTNPMKRLLNLVGPKPVRPAQMGDQPDESAPMGTIPRRPSKRSFPWKQVEEKLEDLCQLINRYSSEPLQLAEALVEQMGAHMGRKTVS